jgi:two-component system chemotaxis sensor kinase CheA
VELPQERLAAGKPASGRLVLAASVEGDDVVLSIEDDGRGIDWERVRACAGPSAGDLAELLFADRFTTREKADAVSGRGLGLPAVRAASRALGGDATLRDAATGTRLEVRIPAPAAAAAARAAAALRDGSEARAA